MIIGILSIHLHLPGCRSLKEKRSSIKPVLARLHNKFNVSAAEIDYLDAWDQSLIACANISNDLKHTQRCLQSIITYIEDDWKNLYIVEHHIEII